jgi:hypothetical protein
MRAKNFNTGLRGVLFDAKHYEQMGQAVWLYGWLVLRQTRQEGTMGLVLGGRPVSYREIGEETGFARKTLERWMCVLRRAGYIETQAAPAGVIVRITKAKKWSSRNACEAIAAREAPNSLAAPSEMRPHARGSEDPRLKYGESTPRFCGGGDAQSTKNATFARRIGSGYVDREGRKTPSLPSADQTSRPKDQAQSSNFANGFSPRSMTREESVRREVGIGAGPECSRTRRAAGCGNSRRS